MLIVSFLDLSNNKYLSSRRVVDFISATASPKSCAKSYRILEVWDALESPGLASSRIRVRDQITIRIYMIIYDMIILHIELIDISIDKWT